MHETRRVSCYVRVLVRVRECVEGTLRAGMRVSAVAAFVRNMWPSDRSSKCVPPFCGALKNASAQHSMPSWVKSTAQGLSAGR